MVLPEKACPGPLQSRTSLEAGTINPARYFLRASHPINNSFGWCAQLHALASWPGLLAWPPASPCQAALQGPQYLVALVVGFPPRCRTSAS